MVCCQNIFFTSLLFLIFFQNNETISVLFFNLDMSYPFLQGKGKEKKKSTVDPPWLPVFLQNSDDQCYNNADVETNQRKKSKTQWKACNLGLNLSSRQGRVSQTYLFHLNSSALKTRAHDVRTVNKTSCREICDKEQRLSLEVLFSCPTKVQCRSVDRICPTRTPRKVVHQERSPSPAEAV